MKNRVILLTLVFIFALFCMMGCEKDRDYDEAEVVAAVKKLLPISEKVNEIYYGEGILYDMSLSEADGAYHKADEYSLKEFGVKNITDIKNLTLSCYSKELGNGIIQTKLSSISDEDGIKIYVRYYQKYSALDDSEECIMVYKNADVFLTDTVVYDYNSIRVKDVEGEILIVEVDAEVTNDEGKTQSTTLTVRLIEEEDGWRFDSPTYLKYADDKYYEDLQNQNINKKIKK